MTHMITGSLITVKNLFSVLVFILLAAPQNYIDHCLNYNYTCA